jgi:Rrf2 family nitric oxide-sensitive transcriptional repressor
MRLTLYTDYALRLLIFVALQPGRQATVAEAAKAYRISEFHLRKVTQQLARDGWLESRRGRGGGIALARAPSQIGIGAVVRSMEEDFALVACFPGGAGDCVIKGLCPLTGALQQALDAWFAVLDATTLSDVIARPKRLAQMLLPQETAAPRR